MGFLFAVFPVNGQQFPSYPEIVKTFFLKYETTDDAENWLNFAKKKDGWYIQKINQFRSDAVQSEERFWNPGSGYNLSIQAVLKNDLTQDEFEKNVSKYLGHGAYNQWYGYEHCRYFGYGGWEKDMLKDFENKIELSDTLLEGLARAYSSLANSYLWYQQSGYLPNADTMQTKLERLQLPSSERTNMVVYYINKSISTYKRLKKQNPDHICIVGNVSLKEFNESMHGYVQMSMAMQKEKAREFINSINLPQNYLTQAKNYLNSCEKDAILFTYSDNDTYQLWYLQEKENYRKDVSVINNFLLGLPAYIEMLRKNNVVLFTGTPSYYGNKDSDIAYFKEVKGLIQPAQISLTTFLANLHLKKDSIEYRNIDGENQAAFAFTTKDIRLPFNTSGYSNPPANLKENNVYINPGDRIFLNDIMMLDIINYNVNSRPIYLARNITGILDSSLVQSGIVYKLFPVNSVNTESIKQIEVSFLEKFADSTFIPVVFFVDGNTTHFSSDGNSTFFQLYARIANHYIELDDIHKLNMWLNKAMAHYPSIKKENMPGAYPMILPMMKSNKELARLLSENFAEYLYKQYNSPSAIEGYLSKKEYLNRLEWLIYDLSNEDIESEKIETFLTELNAQKGF